MTIGYDDPYDDRHDDIPPEPDYGDCEMGLHLDYDEIDPLTGRAQCQICGEVFSLTDEQIRRDEQRQREYDQHLRRELWRDRWRAVVETVCFWRRWRRRPVIDDEVPF